MSREKQTFGMVMEAVFKTGVNVDKDELIRALQYDRDQYDKGYADGKADVAREIFAEIENIIEKSKYKQSTPFGTEERNNPYVIIKQIAELKKKYTEGET